MLKFHDALCLVVVFITIKRLCVVRRACVSERRWKSQTFSSILWANFFRKLVWKTMDFFLKSARNRPRTRSVSINTSHSSWFSQYLELFSPGTSSNAWATFPVSNNPQAIQKHISPKVVPTRCQLSNTYSHPARLLQEHDTGVNNLLKFPFLLWHRQSADLTF